jgi:peptidoglycan hydrolase CwlO-like protein
MRRTMMTLWLVLLPMSAAAQSAPADPVAAELAQVNATLKEIAALLSRQTDLQSVDLLMRRVQVSDYQVTELERRLRSAQEELRNLEGSRSSMETQLTILESRKEKGDERPEDLKMMAADTEGGLKRTKQRISQVKQEIAALEGELATRREELRSWQSVLDRRLARYQG